MKMQTPIFLIDVKNGKLTLHNQEKFSTYLFGLTGTFELTIKERIKSTTDPQNRYYHGVICKMIADHTGYSANDIHEHLAWEFLQIPDEKIRIRRSTAKGKMTTVEREEYHRQCRDWAQTELNLFIPLPNEVAIPDYH